MNENERIKQEKNPLDVWEDLVRYSKSGFESIDPDDFLRMRWYGLYQQKPNDGHFMLRIKVPSGDLSTEQLRTVADVTRLYARGITDITTRQNFQFHWLTIQDVPDILNRFAQVGISASGACGDIPRNVTGCPVAGIDPNEVFDARPEAEIIHQMFLDNREYSDLPRKFKTTVAGCGQHCSQPEINDIGATAVRRIRANGEVEEGFQIRVGGGLSARPFFAKRLNMFVPKDRLPSVFHAIVTIFRDHGNRENRKAARLKFLVNEWGIERFEEEVRSRLDWRPDFADDWPEPRKNFRDHVGIHAQKQEGLSWIGATVLSGRLNDSQVYEAARIADEFGGGNIRTTNQQNLIFPDIPNARVEAAAKALEAAGLQVNVSPIRRAAVACTGNEFCNLALTETKRLIVEIVEHVEGAVAINEPIRINLNGCPNSCGQHHIGDIGLQGCLVKQGPGKPPVDGYDISLGGRLGADSKFVRPIRRKVPATEVKHAIANLLNGYVEQREDEDDFADFVDRHSDDELATLMRVTFAEGVPTPVPAGIPVEV
ncbi:nitrite/sulfite reductase [Fimbriimonas ginsengisoli]|uniref:Nitrite/sulfite reductase n=1 Tax=Fimbriimonas ginsengisoli Gsoil 348 TaxID=661478 RepID=A0A068NLH1_FIMGI|nr:nitrite/sulfite reductase [Fimbriimonas ginsengisoli]AIE84331.1 nitrite/sulfite reductase [Fimbriimonas ginsengisoli Gsoil 348]